MMVRDFGVAVTRWVASHRVTSHSVVSPGVASSQSTLGPTVGDAPDTIVARSETTHSGLPLWASVLIYVALSVLMTWPLAWNLNTHVPSPDNDVFNVYWGNWWVRYALGNGLNPYFTRHLIYPVGFNLVTFAFSPFLALLWIPLSWLLPSLAAYNLLLLLTIVLSCVAMDQLVRYLTGNGWAALVAGITFGFGPALAAERANHLNLSALFWIPWGMLFLTRLMREARVRDAILLGVTVVLAFLTRLQVGVLLLMFAGVYFVGLALVERKEWHPLALRRLLLAGLVSLLLLSPLLVVTWGSLQQTGAESVVRGGADRLQTDLLAYVLPPQQHPLFGSWTAAIYEQRFEVNTQYWAYVGIFPLLLVLYAAISRPRQALPWLLAGLFFFVLALGPLLRFNGAVYPAIRLPYGLADEVFAALGWNWPNRFNLALMAAVSVLVGLACSQVFARFGRARLLGIAAVVILGEYLVLPADGEDYAIVDLPLTRHDGEVQRYYQTLHHKPMVGGWDHRVPDGAFEFMAANPLLAPWIGVEQPGAPLPLDTALAGLSEADVRYIVIHKPQFANVPEHMRALLGTLEPVYEDWSILVLPTEDASGQGYNVAHWFGEGLGLVQPTAYLHLPWDGRPPLLSVDICWFIGGQGAGADSYRVAWTGPDGALVYEGTAPLPSSSPGLVYEPWHLEPDPPLQAGEYVLSIMPLAGQQPLGTYTTTQPLHLLHTRKGVPYPAMGSSCQVAFEAPIEMLGYSLSGGDSYIWADLFWRSTAKHQRTYELSLHLFDPETLEQVVQAEGAIQKDQWKKGELFGERMLLWVDGVPPGQYRLGIRIDVTPVIQDCGAELLPGNVILLDAPVIVQ
jgi:hypothetical protein